jgi:hypothetical protein
VRIRFILALFAFSATAQASTSLRVGNELLTAGDSAARVIELLGKPSYKAHRSGSRGSSRGKSHGGSSSHGRGQRGRSKRATDSEPGEQWQYQRDNRVIIVTIVDGKVSDIDEHRS